MDYLTFIARVTSHIPDKGQVTFGGGTDFPHPIFANCCDLAITDPPVFAVVLSSQTIRRQKLWKVERYFELAQKGISNETKEKRI